MKETSIDAATVKKRVLISLQPVDDMAAIDRRTTAAAVKDDLKFTKKDRSDLGGDEPVHGNRLNGNRAHDRVEKGPSAASVIGIGLENNGPENLMIMETGLLGLSILMGLILRRLEIKLWAGWFCWAGQNGRWK